MKIAELPFRERPVLELLNLDEHRDKPDPNYAGYGWARVPEVWLGETRADDALAFALRSDDDRQMRAADELALHSADDGLTRVDDALVLALHSADDGEPLATDIELEFELPGAEPVSVLASQFLDIWLPRLPRARAIVLALCNPHRAMLQPLAPIPTYYATGDVESWLETLDDSERIHLTTDGEWRRLS